MKITINMKTLKAGTSEALSNLGNNVKSLEGKDLFNILKTKKKIDSVIAEFKEFYDKLVLEYAEKDETGNPIISEDKTYKITDGKEFHEKMQAGQEAQEDFEVELPSIESSKIKDYNISFKDLELLDDLGIIVE